MTRSHEGSRWSTKIREADRGNFSDQKVNTQISQSPCVLHREMSVQGMVHHKVGTRRGAHVIVKPAITPANGKIACAVAGSAGGEVKCLPFTPSATTTSTSVGS
jgi:hypothetical protein